MKSIQIVSSLLLIGAVAVTNVAADEAKGDLYTMDKAVAFALNNNPGLHAVRQQVVAADEYKDAQSAAALPTLSLSHTARVSDNPLDAFADKLFTRQVDVTNLTPAALNNPSSSDLYLTQLSLRLPLYSGGRLTAQREEAEFAYSSSTQQLQRAKQQVAYSTMQAYLYVIAADKALSITKAAVKSAEETAATTAKLAAEDRIVESDKLAAEVNLAAMKSQYEQALTRLRHANTRLNQAMGTAETGVLVIDKKWPEKAALNEELSVLQSRALAQRYDLQAARSAVSAKQAKVDVASAVKKPTVDLVASSHWYDDSPGFDSQSGSLMAIASFNLYDGTQDGSIGSAMAQQKETQWHLLELEQAIRAEVEQAYDDLSEARARYAIAEKNIEGAERAVKLVKRRYGQGRTILLDLLQSERMYTDARIEKLTAEFNIQVSQLALPLAVGTLSLPQDN